MAAGSSLIHNQSAVLNNNSVAFQDLEAVGLGAGRTNQSTIEGVGLTVQVNNNILVDDDAITECVINQLNGLAGLSIVNSSLQGLKAGSTDHCHDVVDIVSAVYGCALSKDGYLDGIIGNDDVAAGNSNNSTGCIRTNGDCTVVLSGGCVLVGDHGINDLNVCICSSNVHNCQTVQVGVLNGYLCVCSGSSQVDSVICSSCSYVVESQVGCALDHIDCTLTGGGNGQVLDDHAVSAGNIDCTGCGGGQLLAVAVDGNSLVDGDDLGSGNITDQLDGLTSLCCLNSCFHSLEASIANGSYDVAHILNAFDGCVCGEYVSLTGIVTNGDVAAVDSDICSFCRRPDGDCTVVLSGSCVHIGDVGVVDLYFCASASHIHDCQTGQVGIVDGQLNCACGSCDHNCVVLSGCGHIVQLHSRCLVDNVDRTLASINGQIVDHYIAGGINVDSTGCGGGQGLAIAVDSNSLVDGDDCFCSDVSVQNDLFASLSFCISLSEGFELLAINFCNKGFSNAVLTTDVTICVEVVAIGVGLSGSGLLATDGTLHCGGAVVVVCFRSVILSCVNFFATGGAVHCNIAVLLSGSTCVVAGFLRLRSFTSGPEARVLTIGGQGIAFVQSPLKMGLVVPTSPLHLCSVAVSHIRNFGNEALGAWILRHLNGGIIDVNIAFGIDIRIGIGGNRHIRVRNSKIKTFIGTCSGIGSSAGADGVQGRIARAIILTLTNNIDGRVINGNGTIVGDTTYMTAAFRIVKVSLDGGVFDQKIASQPGRNEGFT